MVRKVLIAAAISVLVFTATGYASSTSVALKAGTLGAGLEVERSLTDSIGARIGINYFTYDKDAVEDGIDYNIDLQLQSLSAMIDWHPFQGSFRISVGALLNQNELDAKSKASTTYTIGNTTYTSAQITSLQAAVDFDDITPYAGLGWDTSYGKEKTFGFVCELGVVYQGSPNVNLTATGPSASTAAFQTELARERTNLQNSLDGYEYYPVLSLGVSYRY